MERSEFMDIFKTRFMNHMERHEGLVWEDVEKALLKSDRLGILIAMEEAGGEPDVVASREGGLVFFDCSPEVPLSRRSICYDEDARLKRKLNPPDSSAEQMAEEMGAEILNEEDYSYLQTLGDFDLKTQSWIQTESSFRAHGEALFGGKRHGRTFVFYNGADAYYRTRGFRCKVMI